MTFFRYAFFWIPALCFGHEFEVRFDAEAIHFKNHSVGPISYQQIEGVRTLRNDLVGLPDIPRIQKWIAVDRSKSYRAEIFVEKHPFHLSNIRLYPVQPDTIDRSVHSKFHVNKRAYRVNQWMGKEIVALGKRFELGPITVMPVEITPVQYNPKQRRLRIFSKIQIRIVSDEGGTEQLVTEPHALTRFVKDQAEAFIDNFAQTASFFPEKLFSKILIVTNPDLATTATELGNIHEEASISAQVVTVPPTSTPSALKSLIEAKYRDSAFDAVLLLGDENRLPLYYWNSVPGDVYYSLIKGNDNIADVAIGRFPVASEAMARHIMEKTRAYIRNSLAGKARKNVMLVAHQEDYPGKYTANQEAIFKAPNPLGLNFYRQYGGAQATNDTLLELFPNEFGIINYRGHGSNTEWWRWGGDGASFTATQIDRLNNDDSDLAIYLNIACDNGAIHLATPSLAESMLFRADSEPYEGAVAVVASTKPSYTETNHRFDIYLFDNMQKSQTAPLGSIFAMANNRLVQDASGQMPENVRMYLLLGHPLLPMPYTTYENTH